MIDIPARKLEPRAFPAVAAINRDEIVLMGGRSTFNMIGDVHILDTRTDELRQEIETDEDFVEFQALGHQIGLVKKNVVVALVEDQDRDPYMLHYEKGARNFTIFKGFGRKKMPIKQEPALVEPEAESLREPDPEEDFESKKETEPVQINLPPPELVSICYFEEPLEPLTED